jgi:hypothetical protein
VLAHEGGLTVHIPGKLVLSGQLSLAEGAVDVIAAKSDDTWEWMRGDLLSRLAAYPGPLHIQGEATDEITCVLARHPSDLALDQLPRGEIGLRALLRRKGRLFLTKTANVTSPAAARVLASANNQTPICTSSHLIGTHAKEIAAILVNRKGLLSFPNLRYIDGAALQILSTKEDVWLPPLDELFILSDKGYDLEPKQVVPEKYLRTNAGNQPPPRLPKWHSWNRLIQDSRKHGQE